MAPEKWQRLASWRQLQERGKLDSIRAQEAMKRKLEQERETKRRMMELKQQSLQWELRVKEEAIRQREAEERLRHRADAILRDAERKRAVAQSQDAHSYMSGLEEAQALIDSMNQQKVA